MTLAAICTLGALIGMLTIVGGLVPWPVALAMLGAFVLFWSGVGVLRRAGRQYAEERQ